MNSEMLYTYNPESNSFNAKYSQSSSNHPCFSLPQIIWVITDKCNYRCPFCFQPKTNTEFDIKKLKEYVQLFKRLGVQKIDISGGEPMYNKNLITIIKTLMEADIYVTISTNGSGLKSNQEWISSNHSMLSRVIVSLNGSNETINDSLCGQKGAYQRFSSFVELLLTNNCKNLRINTVVTRTLLSEGALESIESIITAIAPKEWCLIEPHPEHKLPTFDEYSIDTQTFNSIVGKATIEMNDSPVSVIHRSIQNYAGYWILNPDGAIMLHSSNDNRDPTSIQFIDSNVALIKQASEEYGLWVPMETP